MSKNPYHVGDMVRITERPVGRGPAIGAICRVLSVADNHVVVDDNETGGDFAKLLPGIEPFDTDLHLDEGL